MRWLHSHPSPIRVIVHLGLQKTGTSSLQQYLRENKDRLSEYFGILTPEPDSAMRQAGRSAAHFSIDPAKEAAFRAVLQDLKNEIEEQASRVCLISNENLPGALPGREGTVGLYPEIESIVRIMEEVLAPHQLSYVLYTREMDAWKASVHNQIIRTDGYEKTLVEFLQETESCGPWEGLHKRLETAVGGRLGIFRLEGEHDEHRPGSQLLTWAGVPKGVIASLRPIRTPYNTSVNANTLEFIRLVNKLGLPAGQRRKVAALAVEQRDLFAQGQEEP